MASTPHPSSRARQTWRERSRPGEPTGAARQVRRWVFSLLFIVLVVLFVWLILRMFFAPRVFVACLPVTDYELHLVPPVPFGRQDFAALAGIRDEDLVNLKTHDGMKTLSSRLDGIVSGSKDTLILYLSAHGVSMDGKGYLLCSDFAKVGADSGRLEISELLEQVHKCRAGEKILILDAGHLPTEPHLGVIVNEFPKFLADATVKIGDEHLWVLTANSMHESSHVSHLERRSAFNYFVVRGLLGDADAKPPDNVVDLAELATFVGGSVMDWVKRQSGGRERQTPRILWGGGDLEPTALEKQMRQIRLPPLKLATIGQSSDQKSSPGEQSKPAKPPAAGKAEVSTTAFAALGHDLPTGRALGSLLAVPGLTLALQTGTVSETDKKSTPEPAATAAGQPDTAKTDDAEAPQAAPAGADPKTVDPPKAVAPTDSAKAGEPQNDQTTPGSNAANANADSPPPRGEGDGKWSRLSRAWTDRDERMRRGDKQRWTAVDGTPHMWRMYEDQTLYAELSGDGEEEPSAKEPQDQKAQDRQAKVEEELPKFVDLDPRTNTDQAVSPPIRNALQSRNDHALQAVEIVAWHARSSRGEENRNSSYDQIRSFLRDLIKLDQLLEETVAEPPSERVAKNLEDQQRRLRASWEPIDNSLTDAAREAAQKLTSPGATRTIEDLLSTPLLKSGPRIKLLAALETTDPPFEQSLAAGKAAEPIEVLRVQRLRGEEQRAGSAGPWQRGLEQAQLEMELVRLADPKDAADMEKSIAATAGASELRSLSKDLADYYGALPSKIGEVTATSSPAALRRADRQLRLLPPVNASLFADGHNPIPWLKWTPPPASGFAFEGLAPKLDLDRNGWKDLEGLLKANAGTSGMVQVAVRYNASQLEVVSADDKIPSQPEMKSKPLMIDAGRPLPLKFRIRPVREQQNVADFTLLATHGGGKEEKWTVQCAVPPPDDVELVILPAGDFPNEALIAPKSAGHLRLSTFPGHVTSFVLHLKHQSGRPRQVSVQLLRVSEADDDTIRSLRETAKSNPRELVRAGAVSLSLKKMTLPATEDLVPIEFEAFPAPPAPPKEGAPAPGSAAKEPPALPSIAAGLILIVNDLERKDRGPWVSWIEISPWAPKDYVHPTVHYVHPELTIDLEVIKSLPQDGRPIRVSVDFPKEVPREQIVKGNANLTKENGFTDRLKARIDRDRDKQLMVRLNVDGYPRALEYKVPLNAPQPNVERERSLKEIQIDEPKPDTPFKVDDATPVKVPAVIRVSAPADAFPDEGEEDRVEVWIDDEGNEKPLKKLWTGFAGRQTDLRLDKLGADGRVAIATRVTDFQVDLPCDQLNGKYNLIPQLVLHDGPTQGAPVPVIFDHSPPTVTRVRPNTFEAYPGDVVLLSVAAEDALSGIKSVRFVDDTNGNGKIDESQRKAAEKTESKSGDDGIFTLQWKTQETEDLGTHTLLVWALDRAGWESSEEPYRVDIKVKPKPKTPPDSSGQPAAPTAAKGQIKGQVTYGGPVPNITVSLDGPVKQEKKTADNGEVVFAGLPPGAYKLQASGIVKNNKRKGSAEVTVPDRPKQPISVSIKLE